MSDQDSGSEASSHNADNDSEVEISEPESEQRVNVKGEESSDDEGNKGKNDQGSDEEDKEEDLSDDERRLEVSAGEESNQEASDDEVRREMDSDDEQKPEATRRRLISSNSDDSDDEDEQKTEVRHRQRIDSSSEDDGKEEVTHRQRSSSNSDDEQREEVAKRKRSTSNSDDEQREEIADRKRSTSNSEDEQREETASIKKNSSESEDEHKDADQSPQQIGANLGLDLEDSDEERESPEPPVSKIHVEIPKAPSDITNNDIYFVKFPNFLSVDTHPYDPSWYEDEIDEDEILDDEGKARLKLKVESTIRWRMVSDNDGNTNKESNTRLVKWSDGSISLHLGCEIFDIHKQTLPASDHNHLFIRQGTGLQGQAIFDKKLTFRPHSTESLTHRKMTLSLAERSHKIQKIRVLPTVGKDPEAHRSEMIKKEEDKLKASIRRENKVKRIKERAPYRGPTASYLEDADYDDDDDDGTSIKKIKEDIKNRKLSYKYEQVFSSEDDSDDLGDKKKKTAKVIESDDEDE